MTSLTARQPRPRKGSQALPRHAARIPGLIDLFTLALTHGLIALALWRLLFRDDLDFDDRESRGHRRASRVTARTAA